MCDHITVWCRRWRMKANCDTNKTECIIIRPKSKANIGLTTPAELRIDGNKIKYVKKSKVLGLMIDDELTFKQHANMKLQQSDLAKSSGYGEFCTKKR